MLKKNIKYALLLVGLPVIINSCTTLSSIQVDVLRPAQYSVDPEIWSVLIVDHAYPYRSDAMHNIYILDDTVVVDFADSLWVDTFSHIVVREMEAALKQKAFFDSIYLHPQAFNQPPNGHTFAEIHGRTIRDLLDAYEAQALIALEKIEYGTELRLIDLGYYYYITLDVNASLLWNMYDRNGYLLDVYHQKDSIFWDIYRANRDTIIGVPNPRDAIETIARLAGQNYPARIAPWWESVNRYYYSGGHHMFSRANELVKINNWNEAAKIWFYVYQNGNMSQRAKAAYNLALSYEIRNDFEEALAWADISLELFRELSLLRVPQHEKDRVEEYFKELTKRFSDKEKLREQLGEGT